MCRHEGATASSVVACTLYVTGFLRSDRCTCRVSGLRAQTYTGRPGGSMSEECSRMGELRNATLRNAVLYARGYRTPRARNHIHNFHSLGLVRARPQSSHRHTKTRRTARRTSSVLCGPVARREKRGTDRPLAPPRTRRVPSTSRLRPIQPTGNRVTYKPQSYTITALALALALRAPFFFGGARTTKP